MITLNEADYIGEALNSADFAQAIAIADGGSDDDTLKIIERFRHVDVEIFPWQNHFGNQRNNALSMVPAADCDWWMRLDADERYSGEVSGIFDVLQDVPDHVQAIRIRQINLVNDTEHYSARRGGWETWPRIFRNVRLPDGSPAWQWQGQVHEYPQLITRNGLINPPLMNWNVSVVHYGWLSDERRQSRETLYEQMPGSSFEAGSLTKRRHVVKRMI